MELTDKKHLVKNVSYANESHEHRALRGRWSRMRGHFTGLECIAKQEPWERNLNQTDLTKHLRVPGGATSAGGGKGGSQAPLNLEKKSDTFD